MEATSSTRAACSGCAVAFRAPAMEAALPRSRSHRGGHAPTRAQRLRAGALRRLAQFDHTTVGAASAAAATARAINAAAGCQLEAARAVRQQVAAAETLEPQVRHRLSVRLLAIEEECARREYGEQAARR
eukprot:2759704-Prymnesium_polylepis.1